MIYVARHTSLIVLLLLLSLSSSPSATSSHFQAASHKAASHIPASHHLSQTSISQPRLGLGPHPRIAQVKPSERVTRGVTRSSLSDISDVSRSISPNSFSPQCLEKNSCKNATSGSPEQAGLQVCSLPANSRTSAALSHPDFPSTCWSNSGCPPPVLTAAQVADIEGSDAGRCRSAVERLLVQVEERNRQVEGALQVLTSGWLVPGQRECGQQTCPDCKVWLLPTFWLDLGGNDLKTALTLHHGLPRVLAQQGCDFLNGCVCQSVSAWNVFFILSLTFADQDLEWKLVLEQFMCRLYLLGPWLCYIQIYSAAGFQDFPFLHYPRQLRQALLWPKKQSLVFRPLFNFTQILQQLSFYSIFYRFCQSF